MSKKIVGLPICMMQLIKNRASLTGYDITKLIVSDNVWVASHQQVYRELSKLEQQGLLNAVVVENAGKPNSKLYSLTEAGEKYVELVRQNQEYKIKPFRSESAAMQMAGGRNYLASAVAKLTKKLEELKTQLGMASDPAEKLRIKLEIDTRSAELNFAESSMGIV